MALQEKHVSASALPGRETIVRVIDSIRLMVQALRTSGREAEQKLGISAAQLYILEELQDRPAQSINQLAERTYTHQSSVSMVVAKLVENRLATRSTARNDARKVVISLTPAGRAMLKRVPGAAQGKLVDALRNMPRADLKQLANNLETLTGLMDDPEKETPSAKPRKLSLRA